MEAKYFIIYIIPYVINKDITVKVDPLRGFLGNIKLYVILSQLDHEEHTFLFHVSHKIRTDKERIIK